jgi:hypothetical protein
MKHWNWNEDNARACSRAQRAARKQAKLALGAAIAGTLLGIHPMNVLEMAEGEDEPKGHKLPEELSFLEDLV